MHAADITTPDAIVAKGLAALVKNQSADGSIGDYTVTTALSGMALLAGGHTPVRGAYATAQAKALARVIRAQDQASGYLGGDMGNMYTHGFATLYLAECYGMSPDPAVRRSLDGAIELIHRSQNDQGGWRYQPVAIPGSEGADLSVTICQIMALRAAFNVGVGGKTSQETSARAVGYVRRCSGRGTFGYQPNQGNGAGDVSDVPRTAAGAMSLIGAGFTDLADKDLGPAMRFLRKQGIKHLDSSYNLWYGQYYTAQALFHSPDTADWQRYWESAWPKITAMQAADGLWTGGDEGPNAEYRTAMALIILQIPNQYLPIFQR